MSTSNNEDVLKEPDAEQDSQVAQVTPLRRLSFLWLIPLVTLVLGGVMVYQNWSSQGPLITIAFSTAEGIEAGKTKIKTRDVDVGLVEKITLNDKLDGVIVYARIRDEFRYLLLAESRFWVVEPTVTLSGVSGLGTLLTGQYIRLSPSSTGASATHFVGLEQPPLTPFGTPGLHITLSTDHDYSFAKGDVIQHQGITVGKIENLRFDFTDNKIYYDAFIEAPYHKLINSNTRFWKNTAMKAELTNQGFALETGSMGAILQGGISFMTPAGQLAVQEPDAKTVFYIYADRDAIYERQFQYAVKYWMLVKDSISGLQVGTPVMYRGIQVGKVLRTDYIPEGKNLLDRSMDIPVLIEINPGRLGLPDSEDSLQRTTADINTWIRQGLVATAKSQNILLGQQMVELQYIKQPEEKPLQYFQDLVVIPTGLDSIQKFTASIEELLTRINALPIESMLGSIQGVARDASATLKSIDALAKSGQALITDDRYAALFTQLTNTLQSVDKLAQSYEADSRNSQEIQKTLHALTDLAEEVRPLAVELRNKPNSLIFPANATPQQEPRKKKSVRTFE